MKKSLFSTLGTRLLRLNKKIAKKLFPFAKEYAPFILGGILLLIGASALWATTLELPPLDSPENIRIAESTKIYDRTGKIVLFDLHKNFRRTNVTAEEMSPFIRQATVAIEDEGFYKHNGIEPLSILRAVFKNVKSLEYTQGGSTITQQVIKNSLLTREKTLTRKIKEWILALKLEKILSKEEILTLYLNTVPYGGNVYGVEEASRVFFSKQAKDLTLVEAAYISALPQAPTYYSPYGSHTDSLENRKNMVLKQMEINGYIDEDELEEAKNIKVTFSPPENSSIKAPHFSMFVREQLAEMFGEESLEEGGLKVITSLDYELQVKAEEIVKRWAFKNKTSFNAENAALVAIDPNTGEILTMVGSRDYFDKDIEGNYNIATALRQPGSAFKPFVYAAAFNKGYRPETVVFDAKTEFSTRCSSGGNCYSPDNYDNVFRGPISLRNALAQSVNVPAVKVLYLVGINEAITMAQNLGITTLTDPKRYGLSLVLGGGEVKLLDMVSAYGVFAAEGKRAPYNSILKIEDKHEKVLFEAKPDPKQVLPEQTALKISDILSDEEARAPAFGRNSFLYFPNRQVAVKTGTTNDYRDAWIVGYTPKIAVGAWAGNNDNRSMEKKVAGFIIAPLWNEFMQEVLKIQERTTFRRPDPDDYKVKPIIAGDWQSGGIHSILFWVDKNDPLGDPPKNPRNDPQFDLWEAGVWRWYGSASSTIYLGNDAPDGDSNNASVSISSPTSGNSYEANSSIPVVLNLPPNLVVTKALVSVNGNEIGSFNLNPLSFSFVPEIIGDVKRRNTIRITVYDDKGNKYDARSSFTVNRNDNDD